MFNKVKSFAGVRMRAAAHNLAAALIKNFRLDSRKLFFENVGILKYKGDESGEKWFINTILKRILSDVSEPVFLDIGANIGKYSADIVNAFQFSRCYAFEPNPITFQRLLLNTNSSKNIVPLNCGAGSRKETIKLFVYKKNSSTPHASVYKEVFKDCHMQDDADVREILCHIEKIDDLIGSKAVPEHVVHFIKIDTEGHEYQGLLGALDTIKKCGVRAVQFEFNEMNVISRVFLKDFYDLLGDEWRFFRLDTRALISLGRKYDPANEIFKFQNVVAIRSDFCQ